MPETWNQEKKKKTRCWFCWFIKPFHSSPLGMGAGDKAWRRSGSCHGGTWLFSLHFQAADNKSFPGAALCPCTPTWGLEEVLCGSKVSELSNLKNNTTLSSLVINSSSVEFLKYFREYMLISMPKTYLQIISFPFH
jgi:hypothetical protein